MLAVAGGAIFDQ